MIDYRSLINTELIDDIIQKSAQHHQSILIHGEPGLGQDYIVTEIANRLTNTDKITTISPVDGKISIDTIRSQLKLIHLKSNRLKIVVIISADCLSAESQNFILKILEEPPHNTLFLLSVNNISAVLPTISSRCRLHLVNTLSDEQLLAILQKNSISDAEAKKLIMISGKNPELLAEIINTKNHPLLLAIEDAKILLRSSRLQKLALVEKYSKDKTATKYLLDALIRLSISTINQINSTDTNKIKLWKNVLKNSLIAKDDLSSNINLKLLLTRLTLHL